MNTEMTTTKSNGVTNYERTSSGIVPGDVLIPRLLLQQGMSEFVKERKAQMGDMVRSTNAEKLGDPDTMMEFIPLSLPMATWIETRKPEGSSRFLYKKRIARNADNDRDPFNYYVVTDPKGNETEYASPVPNSVHHQRIKCLSLYIMLPQDIEAFEVEKKKAQSGEMPDVSKALAPLLVEFRSTSFKAGKEISTYFTQAAQFGAKPYQAILKLGCTLEQNDQGAFYVFNVDRSKLIPVKKEYMPQLEYWANIVRNPDDLRVDTTGDVGTEETAQTSMF